MEQLTQSSTLQSARQDAGYAAVKPHIESNAQWYELQLPQRVSEQIYLHYSPCTLHTTDTPTTPLKLCSVGRKIVGSYQ